MSNEEVQRLYNQAYYQQHKEQRLAYNREWRQKNAEHVRESRTEYMRKYRQNLTEEQKEHNRASARMRYRKKHWLNGN